MVPLPSTLGMLHVREAPPQYRETEVAAVVNVKRHAAEIPQAIIAGVHVPASNHRWSLALCNLSIGGINRARGFVPASALGKMERCRAKTQSKS